mgnify:CR=1 FL=1
MSLNGNAASFRAIGLILAGAVAGLTGGAYSGSEAGSAEVQRELGEHQTQIEILQQRVEEIRLDVKEVSSEVQGVAGQLNRIEVLLEQERGDNRIAQILMDAVNFLGANVNKAANR